MTIFIVDIESVETRYTCQWKQGLPTSLRKFAKDAGKDVNVVSVSGNDANQVVTPGAFLNFAGTNIYKAEQCIAISNLFSEGKVKDGDKFLFTDAWNPVILQVKYMVELLGIKAELHGIWHAGSYDPQDFLGRLIKDKRWSNNTEKAIFHALDYNVFATWFHFDLFQKGVFGDEPVELSKIYISGQPHETMVAALEPFRGLQKRNLILFPHRVAPEKQPIMFRDLALSMPEYEFVVCQDQKLSKIEYHQMLAECKIVFSANLQETLGISAMEAFAVDSMALVPDRLSYSEMYEPEFKYDSEWSIDAEGYLENKPKLMAKIRDMMENFDQYADKIQNQREQLVHSYMSGSVMFQKLVD